MFRSIRVRAVVLTTVAALALAACSDDDSLVDDVRPAETIFAEANSLASDGDFIAAAETYDEVERLYPYSQLAKTAMIRSADSYYQAEQYEAARASAQRYLDFFPSDADAARAQYIGALSFYDQISDVGRDQGDTVRALQSLDEVIKRYPNSEFARAAKLKRDLTFDNLAGKEMTVGRFTLGRATTLQRSTASVSWLTNIPAPARRQRRCTDWLKATSPSVWWKKRRTLLRFWATTFRDLTGMSTATRC